MRLLAVSEYWFPPVAQGLDASSALVSELARQGHEVHLLSAKAMWEDSDIPSGLVLEGWPGEYAGHEPEIRGFVGWAKAKLVALDGQYEAVISFCPWIAARTMVLGDPLAAQTRQDQGPTRGARDRLVKWLLGRWHPRYRFLGRLEANAVGDSAVHQRWVLDPSTQRAWQQVLGLSDETWHCLPIASTGPRLAGQDRSAARQRVRQAFGIDDDSLVLAAWVHQPKAGETDPLFRAFSQVVSSASGRKAVLLLAGEVGYAQQKQAVDLRIRDKVRFIGWTARTSDLWVASDVAIQLWPRQGSSGPAIEALGLGVPVIAASHDPILARLFTSANGACEYVSAGQHQMTAASIANAIGWMLEESHRRQAIGYARAASIRLTIDRQASELVSSLGGSAKPHRIRSA